MATVVAYHAIVLAVPIARLAAVLIAVAAVGVALLAQKAWRAVLPPARGWKQLRMLSLNLETSAQALGEEAINLLFEKHRLNRTA